jgi:hypothetical protein
MSFDRARQLRETRKCELVEVHNLLLAFERLYDARPFDAQRWKRALYHALCMARCPTNSIVEKIRQALELP